MNAEAKSNQFLLKLLPSDQASSSTLILDRPRKIALEYIRENTRPGNITSTGLASVEDFDLDSAALRSLDYRVLLQELAASGHIFVYPAYRYSAEADGKLEVVRYLLAKTDPPELLYNIFQELVQASINTIIAWYSSLEDPAEELRRILDAGPTDVADIVSGVSASIVFSPDRLLASFRQSSRDSKGLGPHSWMVVEFLRRIRDEMGAKSSAILFSGDRFIPVSDRQILPCFRTCAAFLQKNIEQPAARGPEFESKIAGIENEESTYSRKPYSGPLLDFDIRRAAAVHATVNSGAVDPLELPARFILALRERATQLQKIEWQEYCARFVADFIRQVQKEDSEWSAKIRFYSMQARQEIHPAIWPLLRHHPALVSERWETRSGTVFIFCSKRPEHLGQLLEAITRDPSCEPWKLQAVAALFAKNEHFALLMESASLRNRHAQLVRSAARGTIPTPMRWLFYLPAFLHRIPEQMSRSRLEAEQAKLSAQNRMRQHRQTPLESQEHPKLRRQNIRGLESQLSHLLEEEYFTEGRIATIGNLHHNFPELQPGQFASLLRKHGFQLLSTDAEKRITRRSIVLFPHDASLPVYMGRIRSLVTRIMKTEQVSQDDETQRNLAEVLNTHLAGAEERHPASAR